MPRQLLLREIEQFSRIRNVPDDAVSPSVVEAVRRLGEKEVVEPAIREMLYDPTETPHGPTEIADILTSRVLINGQPRQSAFVLKGQSFKRVSSRDVAHQFIRLRQVPDLQLVVFVAVGHIQDDARRDFVQTALDGGADYLIVDARELARLLIAYEKICPQDGTPYNNEGSCERGHERDPGIQVTFRLGEDPRYEITKLKDVSHAGAKRYSAVLLVDKHYSREVLREIVRVATEEVRESAYYRSDRVAEHWADTPAHVVWLYLAYYPADIRRSNWICRSEWIDPELPEVFRPTAVKGEELFGIQIVWNERYEELKKFFEGRSASKGDFLAKLRPVLQRTLFLGDHLVQLFNRYRAGEISDVVFSREAEKVQPDVSELYRASGSLPMPPDDVKDYHRVCATIFAVVDNMVLPFSESGKGHWKVPQRDVIIRMNMEDYERAKQRLVFEEEKIH